MICKDCIYKKIINIKDNDAFDNEYRRLYSVEKDYCTNHGNLCEDAYIFCEYRDITVQAEDIQHVINLLSFKTHPEDGIEFAIEALKKILEEN